MRDLHYIKKKKNPLYYIVINEKACFVLKKQAKNISAVKCLITKLQKLTFIN